MRMSADGEVYSGYVRSSALAFPRGGVWLFFVWNAGIFLVLILLTGHYPAWVDVLVAIALLVAAATPVWFLSKGGPRGFTADEAGIRFGRAADSSRQSALAWGEIQQLRITPIRFGARLDVLVGPAVPLAYRSGSRQLADLALMFVGIRRSPPAVTVPRRDPARYEIPLILVTPDELRAALTDIAPGTPIVVSA
jgi:hypothetical protein